MSRFTQGQLAIYSEEGWIAEVKIVETNNDEKGYGYTLKVVETLQLPTLIKPEFVPQVGQEFAVWSAHNAGIYRGWDLQEKQED